MNLNWCEAAPAVSFPSAGDWSQAELASEPIPTSESKNTARGSPLLSGETLRSEEERAFASCPPRGSSVTVDESETAAALLEP